MIIYKVGVLQVPNDYKTKNIKEHLYGYFKYYNEAKKAYEKAVKSFIDNDIYFYKHFITEIYVFEEFND